MLDKYSKSDTAAPGKKCATYPSITYPFWASKEGGPFGDPSDPNSWTGFTLSLIDKTDNQKESFAYQAFKTDDECGLRDPVTLVQRENLPFLVIPETAVVSTHVCGQG
jgi:hypothetical protein